MYINVAQLLKEPVGSRRDWQIEGPVDNEGVSLVKGEVVLIRTNRSILMEGMLAAEVEGACSRCVGPASCSVNFRIAEEFFPVVDVLSGSSLPLPDEPGSFTIDSNHMLDLGEAMRQYILSAMPVKLLCRPDCAGLCPVCGCNLNQGSCQCFSWLLDGPLVEASPV